MARKNIDLEQELSDDRENYEPAPVVAAMPPPALDVPAVAAQAVFGPDRAVPAESPDFATLVKALAEALRTSTADAIKETKEPKRNREDFEYERVSAYNPLGDRDNPRPALECQTFRAVIDEENPANPPAAYIEMLPDTMTREEIEAVNFMQPQSTTIEMNDGSRVQFVVYVKRENGQADGRAIRKLLALPKKCYGKDLRNSVPNVRQLRRQLEQGA